MSSINRTSIRTSETTESHVLHLLRLPLQLSRHLLIPPCIYLHRQTLLQPSRHLLILTCIHDDTPRYGDLAVVVIEETLHESCFIFFVAHLQEGAVEGGLRGGRGEVEAEDGCGEVKVLEGVRGGCYQAGGLRWAGWCAHLGNMCGCAGEILGVWLRFLCLRCGVIDSGDGYKRSIIN